MQFVDEVVLFDFADIPMVGSLDTGYAIGLTGEGAAVCERLQKEDVPEEDIAAVDPALLEHLIKGGFFETAKKDRRVLSAYLHVTQRCNLHCAGCYSLDDQRNTLSDAPLSSIKHAVDELASAGVMRLVVSGGEPFLREDLPEIVEHAKRVRSIDSVTVLSNGTCMSEATLKRLAPNVDCVSVSFDGCSASAPAYIREEQRFDELVASVRAVQAAGIQAHIIPTVHETLMLVEELSEAQSALKRIQRISKYMAVILKAAVILFCLVWVAIIIALGLMALSFIPSNSAVEASTVIPFGFYGFATILLLIILQGVFSDIAKGSSPFTKKQVRRFRWAALVLFLGAVLEALFSSGAQFLIQSENMNVEYRDSSNGNILSINAGSILGSALLLTMSFVFEYGVILQEFTDDTL